MSSLKEFQAVHGRDWGQIIGTPAFGAALALANAEKIQSIRILDDVEIATKSAVILSDLRGFLTYEAALIALHEKKEFIFQQLPEPEYPDPVDEARAESEQEQQQESQGSSGAFGGFPNVQEQIFPPPKRRGRPPGKKSVAKKGKARKIQK